MKLETREREVVSAAQQRAGQCSGGGGGPLFRRPGGDSGRDWRTLASREVVKAMGGLLKVGNHVEVGQGKRSAVVEEGVGED